MRRCAGKIAHPNVRSHDSAQHGTELKQAARRANNKQAVRETDDYDVAKNPTPSIHFSKTIFDKRKVINRPARP